jgi:site-specific DNA-methyltransferase (adenine-specific)
MIDLLHGDCLNLMKTIPDNSIDMVLTDPPYGTTACKWDTVIDFELMWLQLKRITKDNGAICLFGSEPFSSHLRLSNLKMYKYDWHWKKERGTGHLNAKKYPLKDIELISVFCKKPHKYYPVMREGKPYTCKKGGLSDNYNKDSRKNIITVNSGNRYPLTTIEFKRDKSKVHPTQKPVALLEYFLKTYTLENETVLDFTMGSGSTGVACKNLNRNFIGIEMDDKYFQIAKERINEA